MSTTENIETSPEAAPVAPEAPRSGPSDSRGRRDRRPGGGDKRRGNDRRGNFQDTPKEYREEMLEIARVTRVTAGGRQLRFRAAIVIGNDKGRVGLGIGKAGEVVVGIDKANRDARKNLVEFPIFNGTIPHEVSASFKACSVMLKPNSPGKGIIAGGAVRKLLMISGLRDVTAKIHGAPNNINNVRAALKALAKIKPKSAYSSFSQPKVQEVGEKSEASVVDGKVAKKTPKTNKNA